MGCLDFVAKAAIGDASILLTGETGTGKEVFARTIHDNSPRASHPFVVVDCASLPENLIESTLFGHVKGSFTGAERTTNGLVKMAHGGTLFLDEVGEMPLRIQKTFLRVLQEHRFRPVGDSKEEYSNFRLIAATNRTLDVEVENGAFRADLLFRLRSLTLHLPSLRERKQDIRELTLFFLKRLCVLHKMSNKGIDDELIEYLLAYDWPGNVRELQQTIEQVFVNALHYPTLYAFHLPEHFRVRKTLASMTTAPLPALLPADIDTKPPGGPPSSWKDHKAASEYQYLKHLLAFTHGDIREACRVSGLSRSRLYQLINQYNLTGPERSP
jgi:two-component system NtrC family response regulator